MTSSGAFHEGGAARSRTYGPAPLASEIVHSQADFYGYDFKITPDVLIPRPETEQLIDTVLDLAGIPYLPGVKPTKNILGENPKILDVGTGSGCIAITLALKLKNAEITATDISEKALKIAKENAKNLNAKVNFLKSNLLENIDFIPDLIVANLPYVDKNWDWLDKSALSKEPALALYAEDGGLELIKKLIDNSKSKYLILEADPCQHQTIVAYTKTYELIKTTGFILCMRRVQH